MRLKESVYPQLVDLRSLDQAFDRILNAAFRTPPPARLCHYTDWTGLSGILHSRELWATDFRAQKTDALEFQHADQAIVDTASELAEQLAMRYRRSDLLRRAALEYPENAVTRSSDKELFITSFCTTPDNASVWHRFGGEGTGYAIEFSIHPTELVDTSSMGVVAVKVDYSIESVRSRLRRVFCQTVDQRCLFSGPESDMADMYTLRSIWMLSTRTAAQYKSLQHADDCEWRRLVFAPQRHRFETEPATLPVVHEKPKVHVKVPIRRGRKRPKLYAIHIGQNAPPNAEADVAAVLEAEGYIKAYAPQIIRVRSL